MRASTRSMLSEENSLLAIWVMILVNTVALVWLAAKPELALCSLPLAGVLVLAHHTLRAGK